MKPRSLLAIDFSCAFVAGILFLLFFDFMTLKLELPAWAVHTQIAANFIYGSFGLLIFALRRDHLFSLLIKMNFLYAIYCAGAALTMFLSGSATAGSFLVAEALFIVALASVERYALAKDPLRSS